MRTREFIVCPNCSNVEKFKVFTSSFQIVSQLPELGMRIIESGVLPNLRQTDNYIECQVCLKKSEYDTAIDIGKRYIKEIQSVSKVKFTT